jgi:hypothetical protein
VLGADHDVTELARARDRAVLVDREREHVGRLILAAVVAVELADPVLVHDLDRQVAVVDAGGLERRLGRAAEARIACLDLDQREARRSSGACREACSS